MGVLCVPVQELEQGHKGTRERPENICNVLFSLYPSLVVLDDAHI